MRALDLGTYDENDRKPARGERVAAWVEDYMRGHGLAIGELAFRIRGDKRDVRRLLNDRSCGSRLEDALAAYFGWSFVEAVFTPVVGADPVAALEQEIARERAEIAAREERLARLRSADRARGAVANGMLRLVAEEDGTRRTRAGD